MWKSPDSMPKDGTEFLVKFIKQQNCMMIYRWNNVHKYFQSKGIPHPGLENQPVEWKHLPDA